MYRYFPAPEDGTAALTDTGEVGPVQLEDLGDGQMGDLGGGQQSYLGDVQLGDGQIVDLVHGQQSDLGHGQQGDLGHGQQGDLRDVDIILPEPFSKLRVSMDIIKNNVLSTNTFNHVIDMFVSEESYIEVPPKVSGNKMSLVVKSETDNHTTYAVVISEKLLKSSKSDNYKNYIFKCDCPSKKVGLDFW